MNAPVLTFKPEDDLFEFEAVVLDALLDVETSGPAAERRRADLRRAGLLDGANQLHPTLVPVMRALREPVCRIDLTVADTEHVHPHHLSVGAELCVVVSHRGDGLFRLTSISPSETPTAMARLLDLGPRPRINSTELVPVAESMVDGLFEPAVSRAEAAQALAQSLPESWGSAWRTALESTHWSASNTVCTWSSSNEAATVQIVGRGLLVVNTPSGLAALEGGPTPHLRPLTPSQVWLELIMLLPADTELGTEY